jgi:hypothetical protein
MHRLLLALPFTLLPLALAQAAAPHHGHAEHAHEHAEAGSLAAHEHGAAQLNAALDGQTLELELRSPASNLVGFEHAAASAADRAKVAAAHDLLQEPVALFGLGAGDCTVAEQNLESPLFVTDEHDHHDHSQAPEHGGEHSEIHAHYRLQCQQPEALQRLDLSELFKRFPATEKIQVQLIGPNGQQGAELSPAAPTLSL